VLGHEIGHVTARHTASRITQQQLAGLGLGLASVFSATVRHYSETAQQALGLMFLKYGRDDENQSDQLGVDYSAKAGWDPREMPATYEMLGRVSDRAGQRLPSFLSTHPDPGDRQQRTTTLAAAAVAGRTDLRVRQREYLARIDGILYGRDPRDGYFEGDRYYHPRSAMQLQLPAGWQHQDSRQALMSVAPEQKAMMQVSMAKPRGTSPAAHVQDLLSKGAIATADGASETLGGWPAWVGRVTVKNDEAQEVSLVAAFVQKAPDQMIQVVGQNTQPGNADDQKMLAAVRTLRPLTDAAKLQPPLQRVKVVRNPSAGVFSSVAPKLGSPGIPIEDLAVMNNLDPTSEVPVGRSLKVVTSTSSR
jgi:predicted Zn-dependent protease